MSDNPFVGSWTYRSFNNDPDRAPISTTWCSAKAPFEITAPSSDTGGTIGGSLGPGAQWLLNLRGSIGYGSPGQVGSRASGLLTEKNGSTTISAGSCLCGPTALTCWSGRRSSAQLFAPAPRGTLGTMSGTVHPAGVVASFYAVKVYRYSGPKPDRPRPLTLLSSAADPAALQLPSRFVPALRRSLSS